MLIDFIPAKSKVLYQRISDSTLTFTSNNNLSFRLPKNKRENIYLDSMTGGEDVFVCIKLLKEGHKYLVDNDLQILHKPRPNLLSLYKQFFNYGIYSIEALANLSLSKIEVFYNLSIESDEYKFLTKKSFPIKGLVYFSLFFLHQILLILSILTMSSWVIKAFILSFFLLLLKELALFTTQSPLRSIPLFFISYLVNWSFSLGALSKILKYKIIFIPPQLRKSKAQINVKKRVFNLSLIPNKDQELLLTKLENTYDEDEDFKFISENKIRVLIKQNTIILRRFDIITPFYIIEDYFSRRES
tara:strand:+ start:133244 stop:134146 length:903 start_codon:yes stop_codon:yes gene_type:complete